jgi:excisionase family DNA binding protein
MSRKRKIECETISLSDASAMLGVSVPTLTRAIQRGELQAVRIGRRLLLKRKPLQHMFDSGNVGLLTAEEVPGRANA